MSWKSAAYCAAVVASATRRRAPAAAAEPQWFSVDVRTPDFATGERSSELVRVINDGDRTLGWYDGNWWGQDGNKLRRVTLWSPLE